jgi:hypothetical protein
MTLEAPVLSIRVKRMTDLCSTVAAVRRRTGLSVGHLASSLKAARPVAITGEWTRCGSDARREVLAFLDELSAVGTDADVLLGEEAVSREFLENQVGLSAAVEEETRMLMDLESDEPSEEALRWHREQLKAAVANKRMQ